MPCPTATSSKRYMLVYHSQSYVGIGRPDFFSSVLYCTQSKVKKKKNVPLLSNQCQNMGLAGKARKPIYLDKLSTKKNACGQDTAKNAGRGITNKIRIRSIIRSEKLILKLCFARHGRIAEARRAS